MFQSGVIGSRWRSHKNPCSKCGIWEAAGCRMGSGEGRSMGEDLWDLFVFSKATL